MIQTPSRMPDGYVIWLNGAFGVGKTTVARALAAKLPDALVMDHPVPLVVPMTVVEPAYFDETVGLLRRRGVTVHHFTLAASAKTIRRRLLWRLTAPWATWWALRRVQRCTSALRSPLFATHVDAENRSLPDIVATIARDVLASGVCAPR